MQEDATGGRPVRIGRQKALWARYAEGTAGREPMRFIHTAIEKTDGDEGRGRLALDLGCGAGNEALALLERGWRVHAVDAEAHAIEILRSRADDDQLRRLETTVGRFVDVDMPLADLVFASLSLPFAGDEQEASLRKALDAVAPGGWFVGVFLGPNDDWADEDDVAVIDREGLELLFEGMERMEITEEEFDGPSGAGPKHWHWLVATARRPGH